MFWSKQTAPGRPKHRHLVAVPVVALLCMMAGRAVQGPLVADALPDALRFSQAEGRREHQEAQAAIEQLRAALEAGDVAVVDGMLGDPAILTRLASRSVQDALADLLPLAIDARRGVSIAAIVLRDPDRWLQTSVDPALQDIAWLLEPPAGIAPEQARARIVHYPAAVRDAVSVPAVAIPHWSLMLREMFMSEEDPTPLVTETLPVVRAALTDLAIEGYAERHKALLEGYRSAVTVVEPGLPAHLAAQLKALDTIPLSPVDAEADVPTGSDALLLQQKAAALLAEIGGRENASTRYTVLDGRTVKVDGMLFGIDGFSFAFDLAKDSVRDVTRDGVEYPFESGREGFGEWAKRN